MKPRSEAIAELSVAEAEVRAQLRLLLASETFKGSKRCLTFLEYVVNQRLGGFTENLREKVIGVEAFGRHPGYDSNDDPVVRVTAGEVRKRLAQYYQDPTHAAELRIDLVAGSYVPEFHPPPVRPSPVAPPPTDISFVAATVTPPRRRRVWLGTLVSLAAALLAGVAWQQRWFQQHSAFEQFWVPSLTVPGPLLLCIGQGRVYTFRKDIANRLELAIDPRKTGKPTQALAPTFELSAKEVVPAWDRYVPLGDAVSMANVALFLSNRHHEYRVRGSADTRLTDLREGSAILFGAFSNDWTLRMNKELRFFFELIPDGRRFVIDRQHPEARQWIGPLVNGPFDGENNDYAILTRIFDKTTGHPVISVGGITHLATQAGGEFLLSETLMNEALAKAPPGWETRNLQIVITTKIIGASAGPPQFLTIHTW